MYFLLHPFSLTPKKYLLHFECLAGQRNGAIHTLIERTSLVIPAASNLADSLNTNSSFVNYCVVLSVGVCPLAIHKSKKQENGAVWIDLI